VSELAELRDSLTGLSFEADGRGIGADGGEAPATQTTQSPRDQHLPDFEMTVGCGRSGPAVDRGVRAGPQEQPVQAVESDVVRDLLPTSGPVEYNRHKQLGIGQESPKRPVVDRLVPVS